MTPAIFLLILSCVLWAVGLYVVLKSKAILDRFGVMLCIVGISLMWVGMVALGIEHSRDTPAPQAEYTHPAMAPPLTAGWPCMDGNAPWDDNGRASCLTREQAEARAAHRAKALAAWNEQRGDIEETICGSSLTFDICIKIKSIKPVDPNAE